MKSDFDYYSAKIITISVSDLSGLRSIFLLIRATIRINIKKGTISVCKKTKVSDKKSPNSRLAKHEKAEFTDVNEHFSGKYNAEVGLFLQTQIK